MRDAVIRLTRLVQRAAIYPAGHPTVRLLLAPFLEATAPFTSGVALTLVVRKDRLLVSAGDQPGQELESKWLAGQLHGRGVAAMAIVGAIDAEELLTFARWLSGPATAVDKPPTPGGFDISYVDYSAAAYDDLPALGELGDGGPGAWQRVARLLTPEGVSAERGSSGAGSGTGSGPDAGDGSGVAGGPGGAGTVPIDPQGIASSIQRELAFSEGTGVTVATERLLVAGTKLGRMTPAEAAYVKRRLADVVDRLPEEVRQQLLRVVPNDDARKCDLLTSILEELPTKRLLELVPRIEMKRGTHVSPFLTFLVKVFSVAGREAAVSEAVEAQLGRHGLPTDLVHASSEHVRAVLDQIFSQTAEHYSSTGELYQASVNELQMDFSPSVDDEARERLAHASDARATTDQAARIAVLLVRSDPRDAATASCLGFARDAANRTLGDGRLSLVAELAAVATIVAETNPDGATRTIVQDCLALCRQPVALEQLVNAIGDHVGPPSETLTALFVASGLSGTVLAMTRMTDLPDGAFRDRLGELVARQDLEIVRSGLTRLRKDDVQVMVVLNVLRVLDPVRAPELVRLFIRDPDAGIRRLSLDMLREAPLSPSKRERVMVQAMSDHDADVALTALADLCLHQTPSGLAALTRYLSRVDDRELEQLQIAAVDLLTDTWSGGASDVIATALRARRHIFNSGPRRVSQVMVSALTRHPDAMGHAAARSWNRSAAGLWSSVLGGRREILMTTPQRAETFLRELQGAVSSRRLYAADHPRNLETIEKLEAHVAALTKARSEFSVLSDADRLVTDDGLIESASPVARGIFSALHQRGFDRLTVIRGVTRAELTAFIDAVAAADSGSSAPLPQSSHVHFSRLVRGRPAGGGGLGAWGAGFASVDGSGAPLERVWMSIEKGEIEIDVLEGMVLALGQTVSQNREALIPLVALQSHDAYTVTHITNVAVLSMALATALGFGNAFVHDAATAALLHDVGKLKVPPDVLSSPTKLTEAQLVLMKRHPEDGSRMLMGAGRLPDLAAIVAFEHHLQFDGGGYPTVPPGWRAHIASEITHVSDVYDALRSDRPYRKGLAPDTVAQMMNADAGRVFDPYVLKVFFEQVSPRLVWRTTDPTAAATLVPGTPVEDLDPLAPTPPAPAPLEGPAA